MRPAQAFYSQDLREFVLRVGHLDPEPILYPHKQTASPDPRSIRKELDPVEVP